MDKAPVQTGALYFFSEVQQCWSGKLPRYLCFTLLQAVRQGIYWIIVVCV